MPKPWPTIPLQRICKESIKSYSINFDVICLESFEYFHGAPTCAKCHLLHSFMCSSKVINEIRRHMRWISVRVLTFIFKCPEAVRCSYVILPSWLQSSTKAFQAWDVVTNLLPMTPLGWTTLKTLSGVKVWATRLGTIALKRWQEASRNPPIIVGVYGVAWTHNHLMANILYGHIAVRIIDATREICSTISPHECIALVSKHRIWRPNKLALHGEICVSVIPKRRIWRAAQHWCFKPSCVNYNFFIQPAVSVQQQLNCLLSSYLFSHQQLCMASWLMRV